MEEIKKILEEILNIDLIGATLSNPRKKEEIVKVKVRPVLIKDVLFFQCETHKNRQVFMRIMSMNRRCTYLHRIWNCFVRCRLRQRSFNTQCS